MTGFAKSRLAAQWTAAATALLKIRTGPPGHGGPWRAAGRQAVAGHGPLGRGPAFSKTHPRQTSVL